ncbi:hypothetical protein HOY82DRAFT_588488 [Tuber indicum]|nr:hypothetical protein HOY82DRAFT_588488 [Tuber indicum]
MLVKKPLPLTLPSTRTLVPGYPHINPLGTGSTGKTATVREIILRLRYLVTLEELDNFTFFEINGVKFTDPYRAYSLLCEAITGSTRIIFPGYTNSQPMTIIQSRPSGVPGNIVNPDAIQFARSKVTPLSLDARRALDAFRRAVGIVQYSSNEGGGRLLTSRGRGLKVGGRVTIAVIKQAIQEATSSPLQMFLKTASLSSEIFITALLLRSCGSEAGEGVLCDVIDEAEAIVQLQGVAEEELGGGARFGGIEAAVKGLVEYGVLSVEKRGGGRS